MQMNAFNDIFLQQRYLLRKLKDVKSLKFAVNINIPSNELKKLKQKKKLIKLIKKKKDRND